MLINLSNHPSNTWSELQLSAAREQFGDIVDIAFPSVDPSFDEMTIDMMTDKYFDTILEIGEANNIKPIVHLMGEFSFTFALATKLKAEGIDVIVSTSERQTEMNADGSKTIRFDFVRFRKY